MTEETKAPAEEAGTPEVATLATEEVKEETPAAPEKREEAPVANEGAEVEVPAKFAGLVEQVENLSVIELNELVKVLEKKFGVSAAAVAVAGAGPVAGGAEEKDEFDVELTASGDAKIQVIKAVKEVLGLGLKEAKDLVDAAPSMLKEGMKKDEAEALKAKVEEAGGKITLK